MCCGRQWPGGSSYTYVQWSWHPSAYAWLVLGSGRAPAEAAQTGASACPEHQHTATQQPVHRASAQRTATCALPQWAAVWWDSRFFLGAGHCDPALRSDDLYVDVPPWVQGTAFSSVPAGLPELERGLMACHCTTMPWSSPALVHATAATMK